MTRRIIIWGLGKVGRALYEGLRHSSIGVNVVVGREASNQRTSESLLSGEGALWSAEEVLAAPQNFFLPGDLVFVSVVVREI